MYEVATKRGDGLHTVQLTSEVDAALEAYCRRHDKKKRDTAGRILERFLAQPEIVKTAVLGNVDEGMEEAYAAGLEALARHLRERGKPPPGGNPSGRLKRGMKVVETAERGLKFQESGGPS